MFTSKLLPIATACLLAAGFGAPALADTTNGYGVATSASAGDYGAFLGTVSAYRMGQNASGTYTTVTDSPPVQINQCLTVTNPDTYCVGTFGGTTGPGYDLTASSSVASITTGNKNNLPGTLGQASAVTYADLASGKLGGSTQGDYFREGFTAAVFNDRLTFNIAGAGPTTVTNIAVSFSIDGGLVSSTATFSSATVSSELRFGGAFASVSYQSANANTNPTANLNQSGWVSGTWLPGYSASLSTFSGVYALVGASPTLDIRAALGTDAQSIASATYANTAAFQWTLPSNVTYTSASGVFLSPVPEPGSWVLMFAGVAGLLAIKRRR